jgi:hypothetical protein
MFRTPPDHSVTLVGMPRRRLLYQFVRWLIIGFMIAFGSVLVFGNVSAQSAPTLDEFDPDTFPAIDVGHAAPALVRADETVSLEFMFACAFALPSHEECTPQATLFVAYGVKGQFTPVALTEKFRDTLQVLSAQVPAADTRGQALRYYLEVWEEASGVRQLYPAAGAIEPTVIPQFTAVEVAAAQMVSPELVLRLP